MLLPLPGVWDKRIRISINFLRNFKSSGASSFLRARITRFLPSLVFVYAGSNAGNVFTGPASHASISATSPKARGGEYYGPDGPEEKSGYPAIAHNVWLRTSAIIAKLPELLRDVRKLKKDVSRLLESD